MAKIEQSKEAVQPKPINISSIDFEQIAEQQITDSGIPGNVDMLLDVEMEMSVELGGKTMFISDVLKLGKGSVVELEKSVGEPLAILVNGRKFAEGEVVVIDDHFGVKITHLENTKE